MTSVREDERDEASLRRHERALQRLDGEPVRRGRKISREEELRLMAEFQERRRR